MEPGQYRANIGAIPRPLMLARPDEELDTCFPDVNADFDFRMQTRQNGTSLSQHRAMLPAERDMENYMFPLVRRLHRTHATRRFA